MKIVIVGSGGRLGAALHRIYSRDHEVTGFAHQQLDLGQPGEIEKALQPLPFDLLINCAAFTNVDACETQRDLALAVNSEAPGRLAKVCSQKNARLVHVSTDYVFDGEKAGRVTEEDPARPISFYGESKLRGEENVLADSARHLVVRVSWVFGPDRPSFVDLMLKRAIEHDRVEAIGDKFSSPGFTIDIAGWLAPFLGDISEGGLLHLCNAGACSWQQYAQHAIDCAVAAGLPVKAKTVSAINLADMKAFVARRPVNTVLSTAKYQRLTGRAPRSWQEAVEDYVCNYIAPSMQ